MKKRWNLGIYAKESDWKDFALVKFCLCAMGILIGIKIPEKSKKKAIPLMGLIFVVTNILLMRKTFAIVRKRIEADNTDIFELE